MQANNRPLLDAVRERYTYNLGNGNYLVLEEVDSQHVRPRHSNSLYVRGSGAPNDLSTLVIDDLRPPVSQAEGDPRLAALDKLSTPARQPKSSIKVRGSSPYGSPLRKQS